MLDQTLSPQIIRFLGYTKLLPDDPNGDSLLKDATYSCDWVGKKTTDNVGSNDLLLHLSVNNLIYIFTKKLPC